MPPRFLYHPCRRRKAALFPHPLRMRPPFPLQAASLSTSLSTFNAATGGVTSAARRHVRSLGVPGLDIGFGCGVMLGYGWGAGLMLKPSALTSLTATLQSAGRAVAERLPQPVQAALAQRHAQQPAGGDWGPAAAGGGLGSAAASSTAMGLQDLQEQLGEISGALLSGLHGPVNRQQAVLSGCCCCPFPEAHAPRLSR